MISFLSLTQTKLVNVAESINNKLSYFDELERVGSRLNSATLSVTSDSFVAMLTRLDECIVFIEQNVSTCPLVTCPLSLGWYIYMGCYYYMTN